MPEKALISPEELSAKADRYEQLATKLSKRIEQLEQWLASLPGKVGASAQFQTDAGARLVAFQRYGTGWALVVWEDKGKAFHQGPLLKQCDVETKAAAVRVFPSLLKEIHANQDRRLSNLEAAHNTLNQIAASVEGLGLEGA